LQSKLKPNKPKPKTVSEKKTSKKDQQERPATKTSNKDQQEGHTDFLPLKQPHLFSGIKQTHTAALAAPTLLRESKNTRL
jgi:hypothetical protein